jgi:hypothetical protein
VLSLQCSPSFQDLEAFSHTSSGLLTHQAAEELEVGVCGMRPRGAERESAVTLEIETRQSSLGRP